MKSTGLLRGSRLLHTQSTGARGQALASNRRVNHTEVVPSLLAVWKPGLLSCDVVTVTAMTNDPWAINDPWAVPTTPTPPPEPEPTDLPGLLALLELHRDFMIAIAQHDVSIYDKDAQDRYRQRSKKLRHAFKSLDIEDPFPFRDPKAWWDECSKLPSYRERRDLIASKVDPIIDALEDLTDRGGLADWGGLQLPGWTALERRIDELRHEYEMANTLDGFQDVGRRAVEVILGAVNLVWDGWMPTVLGEEPAKAGDAKNRFRQILSAVLPGSSNEELRSVLNSAWRLAHDTKHSSSATRVHAMAAAQAVILIARTLAELQVKAEEEPF